MYQWGRYSDGHEFPSNESVNVDIISDDHRVTTGSSVGVFIYNGLNNWYKTTVSTSVAIDKLWTSDAAGGANNPCPEGYRVPTDSELNSEMGELADSPDLKTSLGGYRNTGSTYKGRHEDAGKASIYWTSTSTGVSASTIDFAVLYRKNSTTSFKYSRIPAAGKLNAYNVRCIKHE